MHSIILSHHSLLNKYLLTGHSGKIFILGYYSNIVVIRIRYNPLASRVNVRKGDLAGKTQVWGCKSYENRKSKSTTISPKQRLSHGGKEMWDPKAIC